MISSGLLRGSIVTLLVCLLMVLNLIGEGVADVVSNANDAVVNANNKVTETRQSWSNTQQTYNQVKQDTSDAKDAYKEKLKQDLVPQNVQQLNDNYKQLKNNVKGNPPPTNPAA